MDGLFRSCEDVCCCCMLVGSVPLWSSVAVFKLLLSGVMGLIGSIISFVGDEEGVECTMAAVVMVTIVVVVFMAVVGVVVVVVTVVKVMVGCAVIGGEVFWKFRDLTVYSKGV